MVGGLPTTYCIVTSKLCMILAMCFLKISGGIYCYTREKLLVGELTRVALICITINSSIAVHTSVHILSHIHHPSISFLAKLHDGYLVSFADQQKSHKCYTQVKSRSTNHTCPVHDLDPILLTSLVRHGPLGSNNTTT